MHSHITKCPTCGRELTDEHLYGKYLKCPACGNEYLYQNGVLSDLRTRFYPVESTWEDFITQVFEPIEGHEPEDFFDDIRVIFSGEAYIPFVDVITEDRRSAMVPVMRQEGGTAWSGGKLPTFNNIQHFKQLESCERRDGAAVAKGVGILEYDSGTLEELREKNRYVGCDLHYIPMKIIDFNYEGQTFRYAGFGGRVVAMGEPVRIIATKEQKDAAGEQHGWGTILLLVWMVAIVVSAWFKYCYTYQKLHGLVRMFVYKYGYECLFRFLGVSLLAFIGMLMAGKLLQSAQDGFRAKADQRSAESKVSQTRASALRVFNKQR